MKKCENIALKTFMAIKSPIRKEGNQDSFAPEKLGSKWYSRALQLSVYFLFPFDLLQISAS